MPINIQSRPRTVESTRYHEYVPGDTSLHIPKNRWNGLGFDTYSVASTLNDGPTPCIADYAIGCVYAGHAKGYCTLDGSVKLKREIHPGSALIFEKFNSVNWRWKPASTDLSPIKFINLFLPAGLINRISLNTLNAEPSSVEIPSNIAFDDPFLIQLLMSLKAEAGNETALGMLFVDTVAQLLAVHLLKNHSLIKRTSPKTPPLFSRTQSNRVIDYIMDNLSEDITLESLSALTPYSSYHFAHLFKKTFGIAPHQYLIKARIEKAMQLLKHTNMNIAQITLEVGYENQSHFTKLFKKIIGVTPRTYRNQI